MSFLFGSSFRACLAVGGFTNLLQNSPQLGTKPEGGSPHFMCSSQLRSIFLAGSFWCPLGPIALQCVADFSVDPLFLDLTVSLWHCQQDTATTTTTTRSIFLGGTTVPNTCPWGMAFFMTITLLGAATRKRLSIVSSPWEPGQPLPDRESLFRGGAQWYARRIACRVLHGAPGCS